MLSQAPKVCNPGGCRPSRVRRVLNCRIALLFATNCRAWVSNKNCHNAVLCAAWLIGSVRRCVSYKSGKRREIEEAVWQLTFSFCNLQREIRNTSIISIMSGFARLGGDSVSRDNHRGEAQKRASMKSRRDCHCPCHSGSVLLHLVPCCDGFVGYLKKTTMAKNQNVKKNKKSK